MAKYNQLVKQADKLFSEIVRKKTPFCQKCGTTSHLQTAHIVSRRNHALRWDFRNVVVLCYKCHLHWAHVQPLEFAEFIKAKKGKDIYYSLIAENHKIAKHTKETVLNTITILKKLK